MEYNGHYSGNYEVAGRDSEIAEGGVIMYSICITGHGKDKKVHEVFSNSFERSEFSSNIITKMLDVLMSAPFYCIPDMMTVENDDTGVDSFFWFSFNECVAPSRQATVCVATAWVEGWIARDVEQLCEDEEDDESDDKESFDPRQAGFKLLLEYFMMTPEEQVKRHSDYAQLIASLISGHMN